MEEEEEKGDGERNEAADREALRQIIVHQELPCTEPVRQEESFFICTNSTGIFLI